MNEEDIKVIFEAMGIQSQIAMPGPYEEKVYSWNGIEIRFTDNGIYKITGEIPYDVSRILSKQYADERNNIYINLEHENTKSNLDKNLISGLNGECVVDSYLVRGARAVTCFLTELGYFHENRIYEEGLRRKFKNKQRLILEEVDSWVLEQISPNLDLETWAKEYDRPLPESDTINELGDLVERFHEVVNPYGSKNHIALPIEEIGLHKIFVTPSEKQEISSVVFITETCTSTFIRSFVPYEEELRYQLEYQDGNEGVYIEHFISADGTCNMIRVLRNGIENMQSGNEDYSDDAYDFAFDIEDGVYEVVYSSEGQMTIEDKDLDLLKYELKKAIDAGTINILSKVARRSRGRLKKKRAH